MNRYYLKINDTEIKTVNSFEISKSPRNKETYTNLYGDMLIDVGVVKSVISANIALCSQEIMNIINGAVAVGSCTAVYYDGADSVSKNMTISSLQAPNPFYLNGDKTQGIYYNNVSLEMEEL